MIYKRMGGRLGNQMFQYSTIRSFQNKFRPNDEIFLDFQDVYKLGKKEDGFKNSLEGFNIPKNVHYVDKMKMDFIPTLLFLFYKFICAILKIINNKENYILKRNHFERIIYPFYHKQGLYICTDGYMQFDDCKKRNVYFFGYFESVKFFDDIVPILRNEFSSIVHLQDDKLMKIIKNNCVSCVSVRAGDFLSEQFKKDYYVCKPSYYYDAIKKIEEINNQNVYIVFSDDITWVKENIRFPKNIEVYYEEKKYNLYEKIELMTHCSNYILSNSSFSFWVQFLSYNDSKIVVAPNRWSNTSKQIDIYDDSWIKINIKED